MLGYQRTIKSMFEEERNIWVYEKTPLLLMKHLKIEHHDFLPPWAKITSQNIEFINRAKVQSIIQKYVDTAISSTFNIPNSATTKDIENIYITGWKMGFKGATAFRDNCKKIGILTNGSSDIDKNPAKAPKIEYTETIYNKTTGVIIQNKVKLEIGETNKIIEKLQSELCPACGSPLVKQGGCTKCSNSECYYEKCAL